MGVAFSKIDEDAAGANEESSCADGKEEERGGDEAIEVEK